MTCKGQMYAHLVKYHLNGCSVVVFMAENTAIPYMVNYIKGLNSLGWNENSKLQTVRSGKESKNMFTFKPGDFCVFMKGLRRMSFKPQQQSICVYY